MKIILKNSFFHFENKTDYFQYYILKFEFLKEKEYKILSYDIGVFRIRIHSGSLFDDS